VARAEHPLVVCRVAPDNKREKRATTFESKLPNVVVVYPRHRYTKE